MNTNSFSNSYKEAGVDVTAGYKAVELMKQHVARTMTSGVLSGISTSSICRRPAVSRMMMSV